MVRELARKDSFTGYITSTLEADTSGDSLANDLQLLDLSNYALVLQMTGAEYSKMFSALMTGADLVFPEETQDLLWILWKAGKSMVFCDQVLSCVENNADVQDAITNIVGQGGGGTAGNPDTILPEEDRTENLLHDDQTCDYDHMYAISRGIVEAINDATTEIFQAIEVLTDPLELASELADDIPFAELVALAADIILWIQDTAYEAYEASWSSVIWDEISCELFCLIKDNDPCSISFEDIYEVYLDAGLPNPPSILDPWYEWQQWIMILPQTVDKLVVKIGGLMGLTVMRYGGKFGRFTLGIRSMKTTIQLLLDDTNADWAILCTTCQETWVHEWDFANYGQEAWVLGASARGSFVAGVGFVHADVEISGYANQLIDRLELQEAVPRLERVTMQYDMVRGSGRVMLHLFT